MKRLASIIVVGLAGAASGEEVITDGACVEEGTTTFCHELPHIQTTRGIIPPAVGSSGDTLRPGKQIGKLSHDA